MWVRTVYKWSEEFVLKPKLHLSFVTWLGKRKKCNDTRLQHEFLFPVLQEVWAVVGLPPMKLNAPVALCHITTHEQTRAVHTNNEAELCLLLPRKQHIEIDPLPKRNGLRNGCHQAKEKMLLQKNCSSAEGLEEHLAPTSGIASATGRCLLLWSSPSHPPSIYHSPLAHWKSKKAWKTHSGLRG